MFERFPNKQTVYGGSWLAFRPRVGKASSYRMLKPRKLHTKEARDVLYSHSEDANHECKTYWWLVGNKGKYR